MQSSLMQAVGFVKINGNAIDQIVYKDQPVITLRMMDELHQRNDGTSRHAFSRHRERLKENKHFFEVPFDEWSKVSTVNDLHSSKGHNKKIFLTLKG